MKGIKSESYDFSNVTLADIAEFKDMKSFLKQKGHAELLAEVIRRFENANMKVINIKVVDSDYNSIYLINNIPMIISLEIDNVISFVDEKYWLDKIAELTSTQKSLLLKNLPSGKFVTVEDAIFAINSFLEENPIYSSKKLHDHKTGVFEKIKTFESWKDSDKLRDVNKNTGVFDDEKDDDKTENIDGYTVDHTSETCGGPVEDGYLEIGVMYNEAGDPSDDEITIMTKTNSNGFVVIKVDELINMLNIAQRNLDNFPKVI